MTIETLMPLKDAADARGWDYSAIRHAALSGDLKTRKFGRASAVSDADLDDWAARVEARGGQVKLAKPS